MWFSEDQGANIIKILFKRDWTVFSNVIITLHLIVNIIKRTHASRNHKHAIMIIITKS